MRFVETLVFTRGIQELLPDEVYRSLQLALLFRPEAGAITPEAEGYERFAGVCQAKESVVESVSSTTGIDQKKLFICC